MPALLGLYYKKGVPGLACSEKTRLDDPYSPGMESLIQGQNEAAKLKPKNARFNRAYDVCKVVAEDLSKYNSEQFTVLVILSTLCVLAI